jgi:CRP-like cAMP-binding protein
MRKALFLLGRLSDEDVEWMVTYGRQRVVQPGDVLIRQGQPVGDLFLILEGSFRVWDERAGRELARLTSGEIVGEMSFVDANPPSATVAALGRGVVLALPRGLLQHQLDRDAGFAARFYRALAMFLSDRLRATVARTNDASAKPGLEEGVAADDELDPNVLDTVHLAGARFSQILTRLSSG